MQVMEPSAGGTPAPYGRACVNCARAKCRCIYRTTGTNCERCHRLKKDCKPSTTVRKRNGRRQVGSRTAQLEEKLEDLVSLLRNQSTALKPLSTSNTTAVTHGHSPLDLWANTPATSHSSQTEAESAGGEDHRNNPTPTARRTGPQTPAAILSAACNAKSSSYHAMEPIPILSMIELAGISLSQEEAEEHFLLFRDRYLECFPCVYIPLDMTSRQLRQEKPFTWFTVMMVSCQATSLQFNMGAVWQKIIAQKIVIEHTKNIDLLQGIIIFLGWSQYYKKDKPYLSIYTQLALSQVYDLSLNKFPSEPPAISCFKPGLFNHVMSRERTMEDRRTVLACFYIVSQISYTLKKTDGLRWTAHMNDCLDFLSEHPEWTGDEVLAAQVRIQLIIDQLNSDGLVGQSAVMPPYYQLSAMSLSIETVKSQLPQWLENHDVIGIQLTYTELAVLENGLSRTPYNPKKADLRRYEILSKITDTIKRWFDKLFLLPRERYVALTFALWCQLAHCLMSLFKLSTLDEPAWDRTALRRDIDVIQVCDRLIRHLEDVCAYRLSRGPQGAAALPAQSSSVTDIFAVYTRMILSLRNGWATELGLLQMDTANPTTNKAPAENGFVDNITTGPLAVPINFTDDGWLTDIFNVSWE